MEDPFSALAREELGGCPGYVTERCTSTMDIAWDLCTCGMLPEYGWVLAKSQTRGRGQFGREWVSGTGNLFVTVRLPDAARTLGGFLSLAVALGVVRVIESLKVQASIKWPNDIMAGHAKVGGILIEQRAEITMAGIGLNICEAPSRSHGESFFHIQAGCLQSFGVNLNSSRLWSLVLESIITQIPGMISDPSAAVEKAQTFLAWKGESVVLDSTGSADGPARILGIDTQGRLRIQTTRGITAISSGRIIPRVV
ncbi:MAG: biotin--[acetyl-CoA-carboxylase] ligase [Pseudomonadota bacterium]